MKAVLKESQAKEPFSFTFVGAEGKTIIKSENYAAKKSALNGIESVKKNASNDNRYEMKQSKDGKFFFNLKAANGQIVGTSTLFASETDRDRAMAELKSDAASASLTEA